MQDVLPVRYRGRNDRGLGSTALGTLMIGNSRSASARSCRLGLVRSSLASGCAASRASTRVLDLIGDLAPAVTVQVPTVVVAPEVALPRLVLRRHELHLDLVLDEGVVLDLVVVGSAPVVQSEVVARHEVGADLVVEGVVDEKSLGVAHQGVVDSRASGHLHQEQPVRSVVVQDVAPKLRSRSRTSGPIRPGCRWPGCRCRRFGRTTSCGRRTEMRDPRCRSRCSRDSAPCRPHHDSRTASCPRSSLRGTHSRDGCNRRAAPAGARRRPESGCRWASAFSLPWIQMPNLQPSISLPTSLASTAACSTRIPAVRSVSGSRPQFRSVRPSIVTSGASTRTTVPTPPPSITAPSSPRSVNGRSTTRCSR